MDLSLNGERNDYVDVYSADTGPDSPLTESRADALMSDVVEGTDLEGNRDNSDSETEMLNVKPQSRTLTPQSAPRMRRSKRKASPVPSSSRVLRSQSPSHEVDDGVLLYVDWKVEKESSSNNEENEPQQVSKSKRKSTKPRKLKITIKKDVAEVVEVLDTNNVIKVEQDRLAEYSFDCSTDPETEAESDDTSDEDYCQGKKKVKKAKKQAASHVKKKRPSRKSPSVPQVPKGASKKAKKKRRRDVTVSTCRVCGRTFRNFYMATHMRTHTGEKPYGCDECDKHFSTECYLKMHKQSCHVDPQAFQCDICHRNLASKGSLREHKRTHSDERPFQCHVCQKVFRQPALLINHIKTHSDLTPYQCELCGNRYKYKRSMEMHKERIHDGIRKTFPCTMCCKVFTRKTKLKDHTNWHLGKSPHLCEHCGKRFLSRKTLRTHLLIHEDKKPYPCDVCGKAFRQAHVLKRHLTTHTGIKPFRCDACGKQFIHRVYLVRHDCPKAKGKLLEIPKIELVDDASLQTQQQQPQHLLQLHQAASHSQHRQQQSHHLLQLQHQQQVQQYPHQQQHQPLHLQHLHSQLLGQGLPEM